MNIDDLFNQMKLDPETTAKYLQDASKNLIIDIIKKILFSQENNANLLLNLQASITILRYKHDLYLDLFKLFNDDVKKILDKNWILYNNYGPFKHEGYK